MNSNLLQFLIKINNLFIYLGIPKDQVNNMNKIIKKKFGNKLNYIVEVQ